MGPIRTLPARWSPSPEPTSVVQLLLRITVRTLEPPFRMQRCGYEGNSYVCNGLAVSELLLEEAAKP